MHHAKCAVPARAAVAGLGVSIAGSFPWPSARPSTADKRKTFRELHKSGCFVIPNPWNVGSARYLQGLGFKALATTSSGHAHSEGYRRRRAIAWTTCWRITASSRRRPTFRSTPISRTASPTIPTSVAENVTRCIATGVAGLSIEDFAATIRHAALRLRPRAGAREGRARRDRQGRRRRGVHRAHRGLHPRPARHRRDHPPAEGVRRRRRRLPLFARHQDPRAHRGHGEGGRRQGDQLPQLRRVRLHGERSRRHGRAAHQRRRHARARRDARLHQVGDARSPRKASSTASPA